MPRKKTEATQALEAIRPSCACGAPAIMRHAGRDWCSECRDQQHLEDARANLKGTDLERLPGEPIGAWRKRVVVWLRRNSRIKRFGT